MKVGFLQFKPELLDTGRNIDTITNFLKDIDFDLMVLPELANSGYLFTAKDQLYEVAEEIPYGRFCQMLKTISSEKNAYIVSGICEKYQDRFYNSSVLVYPDGKVVTYRKIHLFRDEKKWFTPGDIQPEVHSLDNGVKVGMMICFDWIFPELCRTLALKGAQIICHPSNLVLGYCQKAVYARAVENRLFIITANRTGREENQGSSIEFTGNSVIVNPSGDYLASASADQQECTVVNIDPSQASDKYVTPENNIFEDRRPEFYYKH